MVGLDPSVIASLSKDQSIGRVRTDIQTDFIFAPQYKLLFDYAADDLWDQVVNQLRSGTYTPSMLITAEVPKPSGLTRPGSVLYPIDRIIYQAMADYLAPIIDPLLDGARVYSYRILGCDPELQMFQSRGESYEQFKATVTALCNSGEATHAITTDIASYFIHLNHHTLENLLEASGVSRGLVNLLVKTILEAWSGRFSYGIPQGMFPSDLLGNFYLSALDTYFASQNIPSLRYVDDLVLFYPSEKTARSSLAPLSRFLRGIGLVLNESKTRIVKVQDLVYEQTELDRLFEDARQEIIGQIQSFALSYGFQDPWSDNVQQASMTEEANMQALGLLWNERNNLDSAKRDQLDRFCLGAFAGAGSDAAVDVILEEFGQKPHLTRTYANYLATFVRDNPELQRMLCDRVDSDNFIYDWELQWPIAALLAVDSLPQVTVNSAISILTDRQRSNELRAACSVLIGKFGTGASRTVLRGHWDSEDSDHVRTAMISPTMFFGRDLRNVLLNHWGIQSPLYALTAKAVREQLSGSTQPT